MDFRYNTLTENLEEINMNKRIQGVVIGMLVTIILFGGVAIADFSKTETITALYRNIKIVIDGKEFIPKDVNNNIVEPFIYNGTTYLPVRAVSQALGREVSWDGDTSTVYIEKESHEELDNKLDAVAQIVKNIADRNVIDSVLLSSISNDQELSDMLSRYNDLTSYLFGVFFNRAAGTIVAVTIDGFDFSEGVDFSFGELRSPPSYPFDPEAIAESAWRIAKHSLYPDATERIESDSFFTAVLNKEGGGSAGMWPQMVHSIFYQRPELGETFKEYNNLVEKLGTMLSKL